MLNSDNNVYYRYLIVWRYGRKRNKTITFDVYEFHKMILENDYKCWSIQALTQNTLYSCTYVLQLIKLSL